MKKTIIQSNCVKLLSDIYTPVSIYLRLRDKFRDVILLESNDFNAVEGSYSFICINAIAGIEITNQNIFEYKLPGAKTEKVILSEKSNISELLLDFIRKFDISSVLTKEESFSQTLYGYTAYDAIPLFEKIKLNNNSGINIPLIRYRLYQYVIAINHFKEELFICENKISGLESEIAFIESLIKRKNVPVYPFEIAGDESSNLTDEQYIDLVKKGISSCHRGDVFQIVLSRRFQQSFIGDEFNVYRALRNINPSPYMFYFDYGNYKLFGSSPESQLIIKDNKAIVHPIAGTFKRSGEALKDKEIAMQLMADQKENAEHTMLVDLARNDLSHLCKNVSVSKYKEIKYYSHLIHLVSEVEGIVKENANPFEILAKSFPAGTLSGAPKYKAMELINNFENITRSYYGGCIGSISLNREMNVAIMIRTFLSKNNTLYYQAGAGVVASSNPESELQEVNNKLKALKNAIQLAEKMD